MRGNWNLPHSSHWDPKIARAQRFLRSLLGLAAGVVDLFHVRWYVLSSSSSTAVFHHLIPFQFQVWSCLCVSSKRRVPRDRCKIKKVIWFLFESSPTGGGIIEDKRKRYSSDEYDSSTPKVSVTRITRCRQLMLCICKNNYTGRVVKRIFFSSLIWYTHI